MFGELNIDTILIRRSMNVRKFKSRLTPIDLGVFKIFEKFAKKIQSSISPQLRVPEERATRGLVVTTEYYRGLLHQDLLWKGMWLVFSIDQRLLRKQDFVKI